MRKMHKFPLTFNAFDDGDAEAVNQLFKTGYLTQGNLTKEYESELSKVFNAKYAIAVNSGSSANLLMIATLLYSDNPKYRIVPGDEVIVPAVSWITTYSPLIQLGIKPIVIDVDLQSLNINPECIEDAITERTRAIFAVNLLGNPAPLSKLKAIAEKYGLVLLEDNCESMGASYAEKKTGTWGCMASHSTYFSHHITTIEGGFVLTSSRHLYDILISLRAHGWARDLTDDSELWNRIDREERYVPKDFLFLLPGFNVRTTEINSLLGIRQLAKLSKLLIARLDTWMELRKASIAFFDKIILQNIEDNAVSSHFGFSLITKDSEDAYHLRSNLEGHGFQTRPIVTGNILRHPVSKYFGEQLRPHLAADKIHYDGIMISSYLKEEERETAGKALTQALNKTFQTK